MQIETGDTTSDGPSQIWDRSSDVLRSGLVNRIDFLVHYFHAKTGLSRLALSLLVRLQTVHLDFAAPG